MKIKTNRFLSWFISTALILIMVLIASAVQAKKSGAEVPNCTTPEADPVVEIVVREDYFNESHGFEGFDGDPYAQDNYDDLIGTISNANFKRFWDGSCGSYKVPIRIVAPKEASCDVGRLAHVGLIELMHPNTIGIPDIFTGEIHGWNDPVYDPLLDQGGHEVFLNLRAPFLFGDPSHGGSGTVYMGFQANNFFGELDYIAALPENSGLDLHLDRPQDYAILYRDVSKWLRQEKTGLNFINDGGRTDLCSVEDVIGFGYSFTAARLKSVASDARPLNSTWGSMDPIFPRGRVMDGMLHGGAGDTCRDPMASDEAFLPCKGATPASEGPVITVNSETDLQFSPRSARPGPPGHPVELDHYKVHEINSASHVEGPYFPMGPYLEYFGYPPLTRQNPLDRSPVLRADLINLLEKIRNNTPLPNSRYMKAHFPISAFDYGIVSLDPATGNGFGGISLPQAAAPLGLYRGIDCHTVYSPEPFNDLTNSYHYAHPPVGSGDLTTGRANFVLESSPGLKSGLLCASTGGIEGLFTPYKIVDDTLGSNYCGILYPTRQAYTEKATTAADTLISQRLLLPEEREEIIAAAEAEADKYPECVPSQ